MHDSVWQYLRQNFQSHSVALPRARIIDPIELQAQEISSIAKHLSDHYNHQRKWVYPELDGPDILDEMERRKLAKISEPWTDEEQRRWLRNHRFSAKH